MYLDRKIISLIALGVTTSTTCLAFMVTTSAARTRRTTTTTSLNGLFDNWGAGGSGKDRLDEEVRESEAREKYVFKILGWQ